MKAISLSFFLSYHSNYCLDISPDRVDTCIMVLLSFHMGQETSTLTTAVTYFSHNPCFVLFFFMFSSLGNLTLECVCVVQSSVNICYLLQVMKQVVSRGNVAVFYLLGAYFISATTCSSKRMGMMSDMRFSLWRVPFSGHIIEIYSLHLLSWRVNITNQHEVSTFEFSENQTYIQKLWSLYPLRKNPSLWKWAVLWSGVKSLYKFQNSLLRGVLHFFPSYFKHQQHVMSIAMMGSW